MFYVDVKNPQAGSETKQHEEVRQHLGRRRKRKKLNEWKEDENRSGDFVINFEKKISRHIVCLIMVLIQVFFNLSSCNLISIGCISFRETLINCLSVGASSLNSWDQGTESDMIILSKKNPKKWLFKAPQTVESFIAIE